MTIESIDTREFNHDALWYHTKLPEVIAGEMEKFATDFKLFEAKIGTGISDTKIRKNNICFFSGLSWIGSFCYYYIDRANKTNFHYNISNLYSDDALQYTVYKEDEYYDWHIDSNVPQHGLIRKLSFSLQLSDASEYEGGELEFLTAEETSTYFAPKEKGTMIIFDSKIKHRVKKITNGTRKSIVGWVMGPKFV